MRPTAIFLAAWIAGAALAGCSVTTTAGRVAGNVAGGKVADAFSRPKTDTQVDPKGGNFCDTTSALGWPPRITNDKLNPPLEDVVVGTLEHGEKHCSWKP